MNTNSSASVSKRTSRSTEPDLICLSHLRWNFVFQRPQHLMSRYAIARRVYFVEEPIFDAATTAPTFTMEAHGNLLVVVPQLPSTFTGPQVIAAQRSLLNKLVAAERIERFVLWY